MKNSPAACKFCDAKGPPRGTRALAAGWTSLARSGQGSGGGAPAWACPDAEQLAAEGRRRAAAREAIAELAKREPGLALLLAPGMLGRC